MRRPTKSVLRASFFGTLKGLAAVAVSFGLIVFTPFLEWIDYPRPSFEMAVASIIVLLVAMTPVFFFTELCNRSFGEKSS
jgi:hypothetical protein